YPAIGKSGLYMAVLAKDNDIDDINDIGDISDCHLAEGMLYKAPPIIGHVEVNISAAAKLHDADLATVFRHFTREIIKSDPCETEFGQRTLRFLNTMVLTAGNDARIISCMHSKLYYGALGI
ncbi:hypothetical protein BGX27_009933, partial [Mortierella sp. AM989]